MKKLYTINIPIIGLVELIVKSEHYDNVLNEEESDEKYNSLKEQHQELQLYVEELKKQLQEKDKEIKQFKNLLDIFNKNGIEHDEEQEKYIEYLQEILLENGLKF
jgi:intergrase/recombinase